MPKIKSTVPEGFIGTAAERAAMTTTSLAPGVRYYETDTGKSYRFDGSAWFEVKVAVGEIPSVSVGIGEAFPDNMFSESDLSTGTYTFSRQMRGLSIINDSVTTLTVSLLTHSFTVKYAEHFYEGFDPFTEVNISSAGTLKFRACGLESA